MVLTVETYMDAERRAEAAVPNRILEACRPEHFLKAGYPTSIPDDTGLPRYFDVMHEMRERDDYNNLVHGFTQDEFEIFKELSRKASEYSEAVFGKRMIPKGAITRAMITFRHIRHLSPPEESTIVEIGPGSGYLGALLSLAGYRYVGTDITQAFYLHQSRFWNHIFGDRFIELATDARNLTDFDALPAGTVLHVPWWKFTIANAQDITLRADAVIANHTLCEMHAAAMCYDILLARHMLERSPDVGYFFVEGPGAEILRHRFDAYQQFLNAGYLRAFGDNGLIDVFVPGAFRDRICDGIGAPATPQVAPAPPVGTREPMPPVNGGRLSAITNPKFLAWGARRARQMLREPGGGAKLAEKIARFATGRPPPENPPASAEQRPPQSQRPSHADVIPPYTDYREPYINYTDNTVSRALLACRRAFGEQPRLPFEEIRAFQSDLAQGDDIWTDDERFYSYVYGVDHYS